MLIKFYCPNSNILGDLVVHTDKKGIEMSILSQLLMLIKNISLRGLGDAVFKCIICWQKDIILLNSI